ncbi:MAG TPA: chromosome segregation protein SMC, partial [Olsenella sp.]|nr:chromosome segregation protein SMC [Olsenella sp.]
VRELDDRIVATERGSRALEVVRLRVDPLHDRYDAIRSRALEWAARLKDRASLAEADSDSLKRTIGDARKAVSEASEELERARAAASEVKVDLGRLEVQVEGAINAIVATGAVLDEALEIPEPEDRDAAERRVAELRRQIESIGPVNAVAMDEYLRLKERADYIDEQVADLEGARASLRKITAAIDRKMRNRFLTVFDKVNRNFSEIFSLLFPGGRAHIEMTDPDNPADTGIEIVAQPRGKRISKMMLMSGGEKSLTALALLFAVYKVRTVPFYVFDEVEAALDDSNLSKLLDAIEQLKETTQLIVISHQRRTMEQADVLYGVSMQADGVSRVVSQRLDRATGKVVDA